MRSVEWKRTDADLRRLALKRMSREAMDVTRVRIPSNHPGDDPRGFQAGGREGAPKGRDRGMTAAAARVGVALRGLKSSEAILA